MSFLRIYKRKRHRKESSIARRYRLSPRHVQTTLTKREVSPKPSWSASSGKISDVTSASASRTWDAASAPAARIWDAASAPASLTVEAALSLTLFLLAVSCFWGLFPALQIHGKIQSALEQTSEEMAVAAYGAARLTERLSGSGAAGEGGGEEAEEDSLLSLAAGGLSLAWARQRVIQLVGRDRLDASCIQGGSGGLSFLGSSVGEEERIDLRVSYRIRLPLFLGSPDGLSLSQRSCRRAWTGALGGSGGEAGEAGAEAVYVTEYGAVYHTTLACTHLRLSVTPVDRSGVESRRNQWGSRYTPCERCAKYAEETAVVWITGEGRRYHTDPDCGGLSRTVHTVPRDEAGLPPCSRCAGTGA